MRKDFRGLSFFSRQLSRLVYDRLGIQIFEEVPHLLIIVWSIFISLILERFNYVLKERLKLTNVVISRKPLTVARVVNLGVGFSRNSHISHNLARANARASLAYPT